MASDVTMPRLSDSMEEGTVLKWLVEEGGEVKRGEPLVEIETDKANMTYEADTDGVLIEVLAKEGDTLPIGEVIARIGEAGEASGGGEAEDEPEAKQEEPRARGRGARGAGAPRPRSPSGRRADGHDAQERPSRSNGAGDGERVKASPVARRMARELGVELARLEGSGPGGRIVKADVEAAAGDGGAKAEPAERRSSREEERAPARGPEPAPRRGRRQGRGGGARAHRASSRP